MNKETNHYLISFRMSKRAMADVMYAIIMTKSTIITSFGVGIYNLPREINCYHNLEMIVKITEGCKEKFEELSDLKLQQPSRPRLN